MGRKQLSTVVQGVPARSMEYKEEEIDLARNMIIHALQTVLYLKKNFGPRHLCLPTIPYSLVKTHIT